MSDHVSIPDTMQAAPPRQGAPPAADPSTSTVLIYPDNTLYGAEGAQQVFAQITLRPIVLKLSIGHHKLGNEGIVELFGRLLSPGSRRYRHQITEIDISDNSCGDQGLEALNSYLSNNMKLKKLHLQKNEFSWSQDTLRNFVSALNSSRLDTLSLSSVLLGDTFVPYILDHITTPYLKVLRVSAVGMTIKSVPAIVDFLSSHRCRLYELSMHSNSLGNEGLDAVVAAMQKNFSIKMIGLTANVSWDYDYEKRRQVEARNRKIHKTVTREALALLRVSRVLLLPGKEVGDINEVARPLKSSPFLTLPLELKQHALTFFVPHLSNAQCLRIFRFSASPSTLPSLCTATSDTSARCVPDPSAMPLSHSDGHVPSCENGSCMGAANSISCQRESIREDWLVNVGCDIPDPEAVSQDLPNST